MILLDHCYLGYIIFYMTKDREYVLDLLFQIGPQYSVGYLEVVSCMGPLLFMIYINDLLDIVQSFLWLFANNSKIFRSITSIEDSIL